MVVRIETVTSVMLGKSSVIGLYPQARCAPILTPFFETGSHYIVLTDLGL